MAREYNLSPQEPQTGQSGIDYRAELNEQQHAAVTSRPGHSLVIAGAGSGKTRTLTYRVAFLLDQQVDAKNILLLTFTNKASREMLERVKELIPQDTSELWGGTFHSICNRILRRHANEIGFTRSFSIMDSDDQKSMVRELVKNADIDTKNRRFPKADVLLTIFSLAQNTSASIEKIIHESYDYFNEWLDQIVGLQRAYEKKKLETNSMDFDDLLILTLRLLRNDPDLRALYQRKFRYVLVDEYQDTNAIQCGLIDQLVGDKNSLMVVGDDAQSIYSWRGADMQNILNFHARYPDASVYKIETNYRSSPEILELSNAAIKANAEQIPKDLRAFREEGAMAPAVIPLSDPKAQANFVAQRIEELIGDGMEMDEIAVLYRAHYQSMEVQMEFTARDLPFQITSGLRFFEQSHVKDVAAFIRFVVNRKDEISFKRMVGMLPGIGAVSAQKLWQSWLSLPVAQDEEPPMAFSEYLLELKVPKKAAAHWEQLCYTLDELVTREGLQTPYDMIYSINEGVYDDYMRDSFDNYEQRKQDIQQLMQYAQGYTEVEEFLGQLALMSSVDGQPDGKKKQQKQDEDSITLSTIHQAKGLEWKAVFIIWLADGMFPNQRVMETDDWQQFEEERRLFYVALTRAKDQLYLCYPMTNPRSYTGEYVVNPSRFFEDVPQDLMEEWQVQGSTEW